jgi:universal stress protein E
VGGITGASVDLLRVNSRRLLRKENDYDQGAERVQLKRLLVASDLSARAEKALPRAAQVAEEHKGTLTVFHVLEGAARDQAQTQQIAVKVEEALCQKVEAFSLPHDETLTAQVVTGKPFVEIIYRAREEAADVIVVGAWVTFH